MSDPDARPQPVAEAVASAGAWIGRVWQLAFAEGLREGMALSAKVCDTVAEQARAKPVVTEADAIGIGTAQFLRDKIREWALSIEDPPSDQPWTQPGGAS